MNVVNVLKELAFEHDRWIGGSAEFSHYQGWLYDAGILLLINISFWGLSLIVGKCWPVDFIWSNWPPLMSLLILLRSPLKFYSSKQKLFVGTVCFWGIRLTSNFLLRGGVGHEDWRYTDMREMVGKKWFPLMSLPMVFLGQSAFLFIACLPLYGLFRNNFSMMSTLDLIGLTLMLSGVVIETAADEQMDEFIKKRKDATEILDQGIWAWSRHPNYFGEALYWFGVYVAGGLELGPALAGPVLIFLLLNGVSVPLMEERMAERKGEKLEQYQKKVPSYFFLVPPVLSRFFPVHKKPKRTKPELPEDNKQTEEQDEQQE